MIDALLGLLQQSPPSAETKLDRYERLLGDNIPKGASLQSQKDIARSLRLLGDSNIDPRPKEKPEQLSPNSALKEPNFIPKLIKISNKLNMLPEQLLGAISLETMGTFNPAIKSRLSSGSGLIQILEGTASELGTTTEDIRRMSGTDQLDFIEKFLSRSSKNFLKVGPLTQTFTCLFLGHNQLVKATVLFYIKRAAKIRS